MKISERVSKSFRTDTIFKLTFSKEKYFIKNVDGVMVLVFCTSAGVPLYFYQVT